MIQIAGGVVWNPVLGVAVVNQNHHSWSLPKGHVEEGEDHLTCARREITEETGIPNAALELIGPLGSYERERLKRDPFDRTELRRITMFLFHTNASLLSPIDPDNPEAHWVPVDDVPSLLSHEKDREFFISIKDHIINKPRTI